MKFLLWARVRAIEESMVHYINSSTERFQKIMINLDALNAAIAKAKTDSDALAVTVNTGLATLTGEITHLKAQVAGMTAGSLTQEQIDAITASVTAIDTVTVATGTAVAAAAQSGNAP